jgi:hypothetical protein
MVAYSGRPIQSAGGDVIRISGEVEVVAYIGSSPVSQRFVVMPDLVYPIIIGRDLMSKFSHLKIYWEGPMKGKVEMGCERFESTRIRRAAALAAAMATQEPINTPRSRPVVASERCVIPPRSKGVYLMQVKDGAVVPGELGYIEPSKDHEPLIIVAVMTQTDTHGRAKAVIANPTNYSRVLKAGAQLGEYHCLENASYVMSTVTLDDSVGSPSKPACGVAGGAGISLDESCAGPGEKEQLRALLDEFSDCFDDGGSAFTYDQGLPPHEIDTGNHRPIKCKVRRMSPAMREAELAEINKLKARGIVRDSNSQWGFPVVMVPKKTGGYRMCIDYRALNEITVRDSYPLPDIKDCLDALSGMQFFTTLDAKSGFWQVPMHPDHVKKTAVISSHGLFEFLGMPMGLTNAPASFQRLMNALLAGLTWKECLVFVDDIIIFSKTFEEHLQRLRSVLTCLRGKVKLNVEKCQICRQQLIYLGHRISAEGVEMDPAKHEAVTNWPRPQNQQDLSSWLGLGNWYRKFIKDYHLLIEPFRELRKKGALWVWNERHTAAFEQMKKVLTSAPILAWPDPELPYVLYTDGSKKGLGAVLGQIRADGTETVVQYWTKSLNDDEAKRSAPQLELYALVRAIKEMHPYLAGSTFTVVTDHWALQWVRRMRDPDGMLGRWALSLQEYNFQVRYRKGVENHVDCLSRPPNWYTQYWREHPEQDSERFAAPPAHTAAAISHAPVPPQSHENPRRSFGEVWPVTIEEVKQLHDRKRGPVIAAATSQGDDPPAQWKVAQEGDSRVCQYLDYLKDGTLPRNPKKARRVVAEASHMFLDDSGLLRRFNQFGAARDASNGPVLVVPANKQGEVIRSCHDSALAGHFGLWKTYLKVAHSYWWKGIYADVARHVQSCAECQACKGSIVHGSEPQPIPVGGPFERIGIDFVGKLPTTRGGNAYVLVITDYLTKWAEAFAVPNQSADVVAQYLLEEIICRYGVPKELNSDRGSGFLNRVVNSVVRLLGIRQHFTSAWHPQCNGLTEKVNGTLTSTLRILAGKNHRGWDTYLPYCLFAYRTSIQVSTGYTPFYLLHGWEARMPLDWETNKPYAKKYADVEDYRADMARGLDIARDLARDNIEKAQHKNQLYSKHKRFTTFAVGDPVYVRNMHRSDEAKAISKKLLPLWEGPFEVMERVGQATYRLVHSTRLGGKGKVLKGTFHVERLKLARLRRVSAARSEADSGPDDRVADAASRSEQESGASDHASRPADRAACAGDTASSVSSDSTSSATASESPRERDTLIRDQGPGPVDGADEYEVEKVLGRQRRPKGYFYKVRWRGYRGSSWVHESQCSPDLITNYDKQHPRAQWRRKATLGATHLPFAGTRAYVKSSAGWQLYVGKTLRRGFGLFTHDHIPQGATIDDYIGQVSHTPIYGEYVLQGGTKTNPVWLDGNPGLAPEHVNELPIGQRGQARAAYANEPYPGEWANTRLVRTPLGAKLVAIRPGGIPVGSEILVCYGKAYTRSYPHNHHRSRCFHKQTRAALRARERQLAARLHPEVAIAQVVQPDTVSLHSAGTSDTEEGIAESQLTRRNRKSKAKLKQEILERSQRRASRIPVQVGWQLPADNPPLWSSPTPCDPT